MNPSGQFPLYMPSTLMTVAAEVSSPGTTGLILAATADAVMYSKITQLVPYSAQAEHSGDSNEQVLTGCSTAVM